LGDAGASAIKQNELYRQEVEKLISTLENDKEVRYVFVWEVSRLARVELAFYKMKDYFINNKIQLVCKTPSIRLFDEDWTVNKGAEVTLSLLVVLAKQEMEIKQSRFARAKAMNKAEGRFNGGSIKIGYRLDATKHFVKDDDKADIVRKIFLWYVEDKMSLRKIQDRLADMGIYSPMKNFFTNGRRVGYILRDKAYIGENGYPRIVDDRTFEKAQQRLKDRHKDKDTSNVYYCKGIIRDVLTGAALIARKDTKCYMLRHREHRMTVNLNSLDFIAAFSAELLLARRSMDEAICYSPKKIESLVDIRMVRNDDGMIDALMKLRFRA
jgi:DNA invertase Pin-like site-specific DNA recombinase